MRALGSFTTINKQGAPMTDENEKTVEKGNQYDPQSLALDEELSELDLEQVAGACSWTETKTERL